MEDIQNRVQAFLLDPANHDLLTLIKAVRNGIVYGVKIRFPHALVMVFLFRRGTLKEKARAIYKATRQHAINLATFALIYKSLMLLLRQTSSAVKGARTARPSNEPGFHSLISGAVAGYWVFGRRSQAASSVTQQIVIYVFARVMLGLALLSVAPSKGTPNAIQAGYGEVRRGGLGMLDAVLKGAGVGDTEAREQVKAAVRRGAWPVFASLSWSLVMYLFRFHPDVLQPSLRGSMKYLYDDSESWDSLRNFLLANE